MSDKKSIEEMFQELFQALKDWDLSRSGQRSYDYEGIRAIRTYYSDAGVVNYDNILMERIIADVRHKCLDGIITPGIYKGVLRVANHLRNYDNGYQWQRRPLGSSEVLKTEYYAKLLEKYTEYEYHLGLRAEVTIKGLTIHIRHFFRWLERRGHKTLEEISLKDVSDFLTYYGETRPCDIGSMLGALRKLHSFVERTGVASIDFSPTLTSRPAKRSKLMPVFTLTQAETIVESVSTETALGKRDFAVLMIAKELGIRACDIKNLKLSDMNWETHEVKFRQSKTQVELILPLEAKLGNAIADYILNGRPKTNDPHVFIRSRAPFTKMVALHDIIRRYAPRGEYESYSGFHSFRRGLLSRLLNAGVPADTAKDIAGHTKIDSLKPYARTSEQRLKSCAIGLEGIETTKEALC